MRRLRAAVSSRALKAFLALAALSFAPTARASFNNGQASDLVLGQPNFSSNQSNNSSANGGSMSMPAGVFIVTNSVSGSSFTFVADTLNNRVLIFKGTSPVNGQIADYVLGQQDLFHSNPNFAGVTAYTLNNPYCVFSNGVKLFVCDSANHRVLIWNTIPSTNTVSADVVIGQPTMVQNTAVSGGAQTMNFPRGGHIDPNGHLYIADSRNNRVLVYYTVPTANNASADSVLGQTRLTGCQQHGQHNDCAYNANSQHNAARQSTLYNPTDVFVDTVNARTYVADLNNNRVLVYLSTAPYLYEDAAFVLGQPNFETNECNYLGSVSDQTLCNPRSVWVDPYRQKLVVADMSNHRVLIWNLPITQNQQAANVVLGQVSMFTNGSPANAVGMQSPMDAYYDATADQFFIADWGHHRVKVHNGFPSSNGPSADYVLGQASPLSFQGANRGGSPAADTLRNPHGFAGDGLGNLYVADSYNYRVLVYSLPIGGSGQAANFVLGQTDFTQNSQVTGAASTAYTMGTSGDIAATTSTLVVSDQLSHRILGFNLPIATNTVQASFVIGQSTFNTSGCNNGGRTASTLCGWWDWPAMGVWLSTSTLVVADSQNSRLLHYDMPLTNGKAARLLTGQAGFIYQDDNARAVTSRSLFRPFGLSSADGKLYVADSRNARVLIYNLPVPPMLTIQTNRQPVQAVGVIGQSSFTFPVASAAAGASACNVAGINAQSMCWVHGVWAVPDPNFRLYVTDNNNNRVLVWTSTIGVHGQAANLVLGQPSFNSNLCNNGGLGANTLCWLHSHPWADANGLFVADGGRRAGGVNNNRVLYWSPPPSASGQPAQVVMGQEVMTTNSSTPGASPFGLWMDRNAGSRRGKGIVSNGRSVALVDTGNHRVLIWQNEPLNFDQGADIVLGQPNMSANKCNNGGVTSQTLCYPNSIAWDGRQFFVSDMSNNRVLVWNGWPSSISQPADFVVGQSNLISGGGNAGGLQKGLNLPKGVYSDGKRLWIADHRNSRVVAFDLPISAGSQPTASLVLGQPGFLTNGRNQGGISAATMDFPAHVFADGEKLYVADKRNNRVLVWNTLNLSNGQSADLVLGQPDFISNAINNGGLSGIGMYMPTSIWGDGQRLYVGELHNHRILVWNSPITVMRQAADGMLGSSGNLTIGSGCGPDQFSLCWPTAVGIQGDKLWTLNSWANRALRWSTNQTFKFYVHVSSGINPPVIDQVTPSQMFKLVVNGPTPGSPVTWNRLVVYNEGPMQDQSIQVRLYKDTNANGVFEPGTDTQIGAAATVNAGKASLNFAGQPLDTNFATYYVAAMINPASLPYGPSGIPTTALKIFHNFNSFKFSTTAVEMGNGVPVGVPYRTSTFTASDFGDFTAMSATSTLLGGASLLADTTSTLMLSLQLQTTNDWAFMNTLTVNKLGTADDADITGLWLWRDVNANGVLELGTDQNLTASAAPFGGGQAFVAPASPLALSTNPVNVLLVADFSGLAENKTFGVNIDTSSLILFSPDFTSLGSTMPVSSPLITLRPAIGYATATVQTATWWNSTFTWRTNQGSQGVSYFRALIDASPTHVWADNETRFLTELTTITAPSAGQNWHVHMRAYNALNRGGTTIDQGPFWYDPTAPSATDFRHTSSTQGALLEAQFANLTANTTVEISVADLDSGLNLTAESPAAGLAGWWRMDAGSGTFVADYSGNGSSGTASHAALWTRGIMGEAAAFRNNGADHIDVSTPTGVSWGAAGLTLIGWVYTSEDTSETDIFWAHNQFRVFADANNAHETLFGATPYQGGGCDLGNTGRVYPNNAWHHLAYVMDPGSNRNRLYIDGVQAASCSGAGSPVASNLRFGKDGITPSGTNGPFKGMVDDTRLYNRALSAAEVLALSNARSSSFWVQYSTDAGGSWRTIVSTTPGTGPYLVHTGTKVKALNLTFPQSGNGAVCAGAQPCAATNQVRLYQGDLAGNVVNAGPYAVLVDTTTPLAVETPRSPGNSRYVGYQPNFSWAAPSSAIQAGMGPGAMHHLQVAQDDPNFGGASIVVSVSTPMVASQSVGQYISTFTLAGGATYYWRVAARSGLLGTQGPWSQTNSFVLDLTVPAASAFQREAAAGGLIGEPVWDPFIPGSTAQITIEDTIAGLSTQRDPGSNVGVWTFDDCPAAPVDLGDWGNHASAFSGGCAPGMSGQAASFTGQASDGATIPDYGTLNVNGSALTIEAWINRAGDGTIVEKTGSYHLGISNGLLQAAIETSAGGLWMGGGAVPVATGWTHVAFTHDGTSWRFYVDGELRQTMAPANGQTGAITVAAGPLRIGNRADTALPFNGLIDQVVLRDVVRTPAEIRQSYDQGVIGRRFMVAYSSTAGNFWTYIKSITPGQAPYVALTGADGSTAPETLVVANVPTVFSTNTAVCAGVEPCDATNQLRFYGYDRAGKLARFGPWALRVDTPVSTALATLVSPPNAGYTGSPSPTFSWLHPGATTYPGLSSYYLEVSSFPTFSPLVISMSTPVFAGQATSGYVSTTTLASGTTYYWRVRVLSFGGVFSPFSAVSTFQTDFVGPAVTSYRHFGSTGGALVDFEFNDLQAGVTAQVTIRDVLTGLNLENPPDASTLALYQFETGVGNRAVNTANASNPSYLMGGASWAPGRWGLGVNLPGTPARVLIDSSTAGNLNTFSGAVTFQLWVKPTATLSADTTLMHKGNGSFGWRIYYSGGQLIFGLQNGTGITCGINAVCAATSVGGGQWNLITATYNGVTMSLYQNGTLLGSVTNTGGYGINGDPIFIGAYQGTSEFLTGVVDDVRIYAYSRTPAGVQADAAGSSPPLAMYSNDAGRTWSVTAATYPYTAGAPYIQLTGASGSQAFETFELRNVTLVQSTSSLTGGGATNQVKFMLTDVAGNFNSAGPFAILFDSASLTAVSTPTLPANGAFVTNPKPSFQWQTAALATVVQYQLQVSQDPAFASTAINITTPAVYGQPVATFTATADLSEGATFYWRVQARTNLNRSGPWSQVSSFVTDYSGPSTTAFVTFSATGGAVGFAQHNDLAANVTAQISVRDLVAGIDPRPEAIEDIAGRWRFEEGAGLVAFDQGGARDAALTSASIWTGSGKIGGGLSVSGGHYVDVPTVNAAWNGMTVSGWVRPTQTSAFNTVWASQQYQLTADGTGAGSTVRFYPRVAGAGGCAPQTPYAYPLNDWSHLVFVVDPGANQNRIYVNGQLAASCSGAGTPANTPFRFGSDGLTGIGGVDTLVGGLDEFAIAPRVWNVAEIQAEAGATSFYTYRVLYSTNAGSTWTTIRATGPVNVPRLEISGALGSTAQETMKVYGLSLVQSTSANSCSGSGGCTATNQIRFAMTDRAGNSRSAGPFSILVDTTAPVAVSTPSYPTGGQYVNRSNPAFLWTVPSTITLSGLTSFSLEASRDPSFSPLDVTIATANVGQIAAAYVSTYTLVEGSTYYWRVRARNQLGNWSPYSQTATFLVDVTSPVVSGFGSINSTGTLLEESLPNDVSAGATVQLLVQDAGSGLAAGSGFSVQYSTTAGASWVDLSTVTDALTGTGETDAVAHAQFGGRLYVGMGPTAKLYSTTDGTGWSLMTQFGGETRVSALAAHAGRLYAGTLGTARVFSSANGTIWTPSFTAPGGSEVTALASYNGRVYAGVSPGGKVYSSADGVSWRLDLDPGHAAVTSLLPHNGRLLAATSPGANVWMSHDGAAWLQIGFVGGETFKLAEFNGALYAASAGAGGRVRRSLDGGATWTQVFDDGSQTGALTLGQFGGKLYAATAPDALLFATHDGVSWTPAGRVGGETSISGLASFANQLLALTSPGGKVARVLPLVSALTGAEGSVSLETLTGLADLTQSTNTTTCGGVSPCAATNQVRFTTIDRAGNTKTAGPFAVIVDTVAARAQPIAGIPDGYGASSLRPQFYWGLQSGVDANAIRNYQLDLASSLNFIDDLVGSSVTANRYGSFLFNLTNGATYYWRARAFSVAGATSAYSVAQSVVVDTDTPSGLSFLSYDSLGNAIGEAVQLNLNVGVTAQLTIQDVTSGIQRDGPAPHGPSTWTVVLWHLDEGSGGVVNDAGFLGHNGVLLGAPAWVNGRHAKGLWLDGTGSQYVHMGHLASLEPASALTVSAWVSTILPGWVVAKGDAGGVSYGLRVEADGTPSAVLGGTTINCAAVKVADGRWHMLAATVGGGTGRVYVDGAPCASAAAAASPTTANLRLGQRGDGSPPYFAGAIDEARVLGHAATAAELAADYSAGTPFTVLLTTSAGQSWRTITSVSAGAAPRIAFPGAQFDKTAVSLQARELGLATSTTGATCGAVSPCGATNQLRFVYSDRAGNVRSAGPYAVLVDTSMTQPFAITPPDQSFVSTAAPFFSWTESIPVAVHQVQVSTDDFATVNVSSTVTSVTLVSPWTLTHGATYYWRVRGVDAIGLTSPFSPTHRFVMDLAGVAGSGFATVTSTGGLAGETQFNDLAAGVTAQLTIQDLVSGLAGPSLGVSADAGTVGLWRFDEGAGGAALDASGQGNSGTLMGGAAWFAGRIKTAIGFTGVQEVRAPYAASLNTPAAMTIEAWVKTSNTNAAADGQAVVTRWSGSSGFMLTTSRTGTGGRPAFYAGVGAQWLVGSRTVADGQWHHLAATYDGTTARLFVDGVFDGSAAVTNGLANTSTPLSIGTAPNDLQAVGFTGTIDDVRLSNFARTPAQLEQSYSAGVGFYAEVSSNTGVSFATIFATAPAGSAPYVVVSGAPGATTAQTIEARNLVLGQSASAAVCGGVGPCAGATNQIKYHVYDRAGNLRTFGPFAILVDTQLSQPVAGSPADAAYVSTSTPLLSWWEKAVMPMHTVQLSTSPVFATLTYSTSTSLSSARAPALTAGATYYWRVRSQNGAGLQSGFSTPNQFFVDFSTPLLSSARVLNSTGGVISEAQFTTLATGVTSLIAVQDGPSGLMLSSAAFSGSGFGVMYSTNAGASWIDHASVATVLSGTGETYVTSLAPFNGRLYAGTIPSARVYSSVDGVNWGVVLSGTGESQINALASFKGRIYAATYPTAKVFSSADGTSWSQVLSGTGETDVRSLAVFNNRLYAGLSSGRVYATTDGTSWQLMTTLPGVNFVDSLAVFNGRLYAGTQPGGTVYSTPDGFTWTSAASFAGETRVLALAVYGGALFAGTGLNAKVFRTLDGANWTQVYQAAGESNIHALALAAGKLYAGSSLNGRVHVTPDGSNWAPTSLATGQSNVQTLASWNGKLYAGTFGSGRILQVTPLSAALSGSDGSGAPETLTARDLNFVQSASTQTCSGVWGCAATQQLVFSAFDRAGNAGAFGPYAVLVDSSVPRPVIASLTPLTTESIRVDVVPVVDGLSGLRDYQFYLSSSPNFAAPVSTTAFVNQSTWTFTGLQQVTTYYVRVAARDNLLNISPYSVTAATATNGVMFFSTADISVPTVMQGLGTPMMSFTMATLPGPAAVFNRVTVARVGGVDSDVAQAEVWTDANANSVFDGGDIQLAAAAFSGGQAQINLGANAQNVGTSTMTFFVIFRLSPTATIGSFIAAQLDDFSAIGFGNSYRVPGAFPMTTAASQVLDGPNELLITPLSQAPLLAAPGQADVPLLRLRMQTSQGTSVISKLVLRLLGTAASNEISAVRVYRDNNSNGSYDATDGLVTNGNDVFVSGVSTLNFTAQTSSVTVSPSLVDYFVTFNAALSAVSGNTFGVSLDTGTLVTLTGPDTGYLTVLPATSTLVQVVQPNTLYFAGVSQTPATVFQGDQYAVMKATLTVDQAFARLAGVSVNRTGSSVDSDVSRVSIWLNQAPPALGGYFNPGVDLRLGTGTFSGGKADIAFSPITLNAGATNVVYVVYELNPLANAGNTIGASLTNSSYLSIVSTATSVAGVFPFGSSTATINATVNTMLIPTAQDVTTGGLLQGATIVPMLRLDVRTDRNALTWSGLAVTKTGSAPDSAVSRVYVYADTNGNFQLDAGTDTRVSSGADVFVSSVANMTFPSAQAVGVSSQTFFVALSIDSLASAGETVGVQIATTSAFNLSAPNVVSSVTASFPINAGPVPIQQFPNSIAVTTATIAPASAAPGAANIGLLKLTLNTDVSTARWTGLKLDRVGGSDADVASVKVYYDINQIGSWNASQSAQYLLLTSTLSTFGSDGSPGTINVAFSTVATLTTTPQSYFVVVDLAATATPGNSFAGRILNQNYFTVNAPNAVVATSAQSSNLTVSAPPSLMVVTAVSSAPAVVTQSDTNVPIMRLSVAMQQYTGQWSGMTVLRQGTASDADISRVKLYYDLNLNGQLDPLLDTLVGTGTFTTGQAALSFNSVQTVVTTPRTYFLAYDIAAVATANATAGASLGGPGSFSIAAPNGVLNSGFPMASGLSTINATQSGVFIIAQDKAPAALMQGATSQVMLSLQMNTTQYSVLWNTLQVTRLGTSVDGDVTAVRVYRDANADGLIDAGDQEISSGNDRFLAGTANITLGAPQQLDTTPRSYLVALDVYMFAASTGTLGVRISSAASFGVPAPNFVVNTGFPVATSLSPIVKRPDTMFMSWTDMVPTGINQGVELPMAKVVAYAQRDYVNWVQLRLLRQGSLSDGFINMARLYEDANNSGTFDAADVQVGSGTVGSGLANIQFAQVQRMTPAAKTYFVTFVFDVNSTVGGTVGFSVPDTSYVIVQSPDGVSGSSLPFTTSVAGMLDARTPTMPFVTPDGPFTSSFEQLHFVWGSTVALGQITNVVYAVGTTPGAADTYPWTSMNPIAPAVNIRGLALQTGATYYISVRAQSSFGFVSPTGVSAPILVDLTVPSAPNLNATVGQVSVLLNWTPASAGPSGLLGYLVEFRTGASPQWKNAKTGQATTQGVLGLDEYQPKAMGPSNLTAADVVPSLAWSMNPPSSTIFVRVSAVTGAGMAGASSTPMRLLFGTLKPGEISEVSSYPNPFDSRKGAATINYTLPSAADVTIKIFSVYGNLIKSMSFSAGGKGGIAGANDVQWDGSDSSGAKTAKGIYLAVITSGGAKATHKIAVIH